MPLVDGASLLGFATVDHADLHITDDGRELYEYDANTGELQRDRLAHDPETDPIEG